MVKKHLPLIINVILLIGIVGVAYAWMVTTASSGETLDYNRKLIVSPVDLDIKLYKMVKERYQEVNEDVIALDYLAPNDTVYFKFSVSNNSDLASTARIVIGGFTGDMLDLKDVLYFGVTKTHEEKKLADYIEYNESSDYYYLTLTTNIFINGYENQDIEWYIYVDKNAGNEIANKGLSIESINFIKP